MSAKDVLKSGLVLCERGVNAKWTRHFAGAALTLVAGCATPDADFKDPEGGGRLVDDKGVCTQGTPCYKWHNNGNSDSNVSSGSDGRELVITNDGQRFLENDDAFDSARDVGINSQAIPKETVNGYTQFSFSPIGELPQGFNVDRDSTLIGGDNCWDYVMYNEAPATGFNYESFLEGTPVFFIRESGDAGCDYGNADETGTADQGTDETDTSEEETDTTGMIPDMPEDEGCELDLDCKDEFVCDGNNDCVEPDLRYAYTLTSQSDNPQEKPWFSDWATQLTLEAQVKDLTPDIVLWRDTQLVTLASAANGQGYGIEMVAEEDCDQEAFILQGQAQEDGPAQFDRIKLEPNMPEGQLEQCHVTVDVALEHKGKVVSYPAKEVTVTVNTAN